MNRLKIVVNIDNMQYIDLLKELKQMSPEQLSSTVLIYDITLHKMFPAEHKLNYANNREDVVNGHPYFSY